MTDLAEKPATRGIEWVPVLFGLAAMYVPSIVDLAMTLWKSEEQIHGPIILSVTLYLFWTLRHAVQDAPIHPRGAVGWPLLVFGLLLYILGRSQDIILFELGSLLCILPAVLLIQRGTEALRACWFPIFFLVFMIPLPSSVVDTLTLPMKTFVSWATEHILYSLGYSITRSGVILYLGQYQLLVANACAGLHTLFSLEALGLLYLHLTKHESWARNAALAMLIVPISFTANVIRVLSLSLITYHFGDEAGQGFLHGFAGMVLFVSALLLIIAIDSAIQFFLSLRRHQGSVQSSVGEEASISLASSPNVSAYVSPRTVSRFGIFTGLLLFLAIALAIVLKPKPISVSEHPNLDAMIPKQFGEWVVDSSIIPILPNPNQQQAISETYDQLVNRTYVNRAGKGIMISIAYGSQQSQNLKAHRQEVCYAAQGFKIKNIEHARVRVAGREISVTNMFAISNQRAEPVTYWFTVGNQVVQSRLQRFVAQMQYGLSGVIPDGFLVRVSSINSNEWAAYQEHLEFINEMLETMPPGVKARLVGGVGD